MMTPFVAPSLSGMALLHGLSPDARSSYRFFGFQDYDVDQILSAKWVAEKAPLCLEAVKRDFSYVIVMDEKAGQLVTQEFDCTRPARP